MTDVSGGPGSYAGRMRRTDAALAAATTVVVSAAALAQVAPDRPPPSPGVFVAAVLFGAVLLVRRRWPVGVLLVSCAGLLGYYTAGFTPIGMALPLGAALYTAAATGHLRWAVGAGTAMIVVSTVARVRTGQSVSYLFGWDLPITVALMGAAVAFGDGVRSRRRFRAAVLARAAADREHQVEQERLRVARDVHDVLAHTMSVVSLHADVAAESLDDDPAAARAALGHIRRASSDAGTELRRTVGLLRAPCGGIAGLAALAEVSGAAGLPVRVSTEGVRRELRPEVDEAVYRVVQEAVTNARRHARPDRVDVRLDWTGPGLRLTISDDGPPAAPCGGAGQGLTGMRERVTLLGGRFDAGPVPPCGFRVEAVLPA